MELTTKTWKEFSLLEVFETIQRGKRLKKDDHLEGKIPYASSTSLNNGIDGFIGNTENVRTFSDCLTIANSGSVGSTFYQPFSVIASDHVTKLQSKKFNKYIYLFLATVVSRISAKYSFNREINDLRIKKEKVLLPITDKGEPDYLFMENFMRKKEEELLKKYNNYMLLKMNKLKRGGVILNGNREWKEFFIDDIFSIKSGKRLTKADMIDGVIPFIGATDAGNGITEFIGNKNASLDMNVLGVNYNGSVVENFYHPYKAVFSDDVKRLSFSKTVGTKHKFLFCKSAILMQKVKYEYGYKFNGERMKRQKIMLPTDRKGNPDYEYMEQFMVDLEYHKLKRYLDFKSRNERE